MYRTVRSMWVQWAALLIASHAKKPTVSCEWLPPATAESNRHFSCLQDSWLRCTQLWTAAICLAHKQACAIHYTPGRVTDQCKQTCLYTLLDTVHLAVTCSTGGVAEQGLTILQLWVASAIQYCVPGTSASQLYQTSYAEQEMRGISGMQVTQPKIAFTHIHNLKAQFT